MKNHEKQIVNIFINNQLLLFGPGCRINLA